MREYLLKINLNHFWHSGTGAGSGTHVDATTEKTPELLPFLSGKHLKGLLRHAVHRAEHWSWLDQVLPDGPAADLETLIFGSRSQQEQRQHTLPGMLHIDDAELPKAERDYLNAHSELKPFLYQDLYSTSITESGVAKEHSLRGVEVILPVTLHARLALNITGTNQAHRKQQENWLKTEQPLLWLNKVLPLIDAVGANRTRGLGEAVLSLSEHMQEKIA